MNGCGVGVNAQMRPEHARTLTRQRESEKGGGGGGSIEERKKELNRESQWCRCECANELEQLNAVRVAKVNIRPAS